MINKLNQKYREIWHDKEVPKPTKVLRIISLSTFVLSIFVMAVILTLVYPIKITLLALLGLFLHGLMLATGDD